MTAIADIQAEIEEEFSLFDEWMDKYQHLIDMAAGLEPYPEQWRDDAHLIKGCQSRVWMHAQLSGEVLRYYADSDAVITKGIAALMLRVFDKQRPVDVVQAPMDFIERIGLKEHLSPTRSNGLQAMIKQMKLYALAQKSQLELKNG